MKKIDKIKRRRRKPGEYATRKVAVRMFCLECCGYNSAEVRRCTAEDCWLYPYRQGQLDKDLLKSEEN